MALFRKFFNRKRPDRLVEIAERVYGAYALDIQSSSSATLFGIKRWNSSSIWCFLSIFAVFDSCLTLTIDVLDEDKYRHYIEDIVRQLQDYYPDASFMAFNFGGNGRSRSLLSDLLSSYDMTVMDYPRQYEGCTLLPIEMINHALRSGETWLSLEGQNNVLLMHCERGGWAVLAFMVAALLLHRKTYIGEQKTLEMVYKQAPSMLIRYFSPLNPMPSQMRYLHYMSQRNVNSEWPPGARPFALDCVILRSMPVFKGGYGCRLIFRIHGKDPLLVRNDNLKVFSSTPKELYKKVSFQLLSDACTISVPDPR
jgi:hypothetical protein